MYTNTQFALAVLMFIAFCGLIGFATWFTGSGWCLWALLLFPGIKGSTT